MGETVSSHPVYDWQGNVYATKVIRELPNGTRTETIEPLEVPAMALRLAAGAEASHRGARRPDIEGAVSKHSRQSPIGEIEQGEELTR